MDYSLSDLKSVVGEGGGAMDSWFWIVVLFLFGIGGNGIGGFGGNGGQALTRAELNEGFAINNVDRQLQGITNGLSDGFYAQNTTMLQGFNAQNVAALQGFNAMGTQIADSRFAAQQCCCETNRNIDSLKAENYRNTCEIVKAIGADGEATRGLITANTIQNLRERLSTAENQNSNNAQSRYILSELGRYVTNPPCSPCTSCCG